MVSQVVVSPSPNGFSVSDFDALPEAEPATLPEIAEAESQDRTPDTADCATCGNVITRAPGARGRMPKYHPECRPSAKERLTGTGRATAKQTANTRASKEADECIVLFKGAMVKLAMGLSVVDKYDGFVVMSALPDACSNLHGVLVSHDSWRKDFLAIRSGGSIIGLIISVLMMAVPIVAHHGLIPSERISALLVNLPITMFRIQKQMAEGQAAMMQMVEDMANGLNPVSKKPVENPSDGS